jgi:plastocyanin
MTRLRLISAAGALALAACSTGGSTATTGGSTTGTSGGSTTGGGTVATITISNYTFSPDPLSVAPGTVITVNNTDTVVHTTTSEAAAGNYTSGQANPGFLFDTGDIPAHGSATFTVPSTTASGTIQNYFCDKHKGMMANPNPEIVVEVAQ